MRAAAAIGVLAFLAAGTARAGSSVALRTEARVAAGYVALADIAELSGDPLPQVWFGTAPAAGGARRITADDVRSELRKAGAPIRGVTVTGDCLVRGPEEDPRPGIEGFRVIAGRAIGEAVRAQYPGATVEAGVLELDAPAEADFARATIVAVRPADTWWLGDARFRLHVNLGDTDSAVWTARATVRGTRPALVARRPLRAGHRIVSTDLERGVAPVQAKAVFEENRAVGRLLDVDVAAGEPLVESALRAGAVLFKGETLTVTSSNGRAEARRTAVALEDGRVDEVVRVKNPDSKKEFRVRVTGPGAGDAVEE